MDMRERFSMDIYHKQNLLIIFGGYYCSQDMEFENYYNDLVNILFCLKKSV